MIHHEAGVQHAGERGAPALHLLERRKEHLAPGAIEQRGRGDRHRTVRTHPAGVGSGVAFEQALVVLGDGQQLDVAPVGDGEDRDLLALEERLDHNGGAGLAERAVAQHRPDGGGGLRAGETDDGALAGGEARRLDHEGLGVAIDVGQGRPQLLERPAGGGGYGGRGHHVLRERLRRLDLCRRGAGAEHRSPLGAKPVRQPAGERHLGADDGEVDAVHIGQVGQAIEIVRRDGQVGGERGGAGIAGRAVEVGLGVLPPDRPAERMFPASAADHQGPHGFWALRNASRARSAARLAASATWVASSRASPA